MSHGFLGYGLLIVAWLTLLLGIWLGLRPRKAKPPVSEPLATFEPIDSEDPDDPMHDPAVVAMMREVIRTGRPMHMIRGEAATYVDDDAPPTLPSPSCVPKE